MSLDPIDESIRPRCRAARRASELLDIVDNANHGLIGTRSSRHAAMGAPAAATPEGWSTVSSRSTSTSGPCRGRGDEGHAGIARECPSRSTLAVGGTTSARSHSGRTTPRPRDAPSHDGGHRARRTILRRARRGATRPQRRRRRGRFRSRTHPDSTTAAVAWRRQRCPSGFVSGDELLAQPPLDV